VKRVFVATLFFAGLFLLWQIASMTNLWSPVLLPPPLSVAEYLVDALRDGTLIAAMIVTVKRLLIGYAIGWRSGFRSA
jgi:NitT/TauT family transport system permease protein